jgi:hypothetical protein
MIFASETVSTRSSWLTLYCLTYGTVSWGI